MGYVPRIAVVGGGVSGLVLGKELASRGLHATVFEDVHLTFDFGVDCAFYVTEAVYVFNFGTGTEFFLTFRAQRDVTVTTH